ncbi:MAG: hypothetical protein WBW33_24105 [Bryobacteraceae bacterium]
MTESVPLATVIPDAGVVDRYEELRRQHGLTPCGRTGGGLGLGLFLRQGMKGWMDGWSRCVAAGPAKAPDRSKPGEGIVPWDLRGEVAAILAGMALSIGQQRRV